MQAPTRSASTVTVGLVQITEPAEFLVYLPYAAGLLQAYVMAHAANPERYRFLLPQFQRKNLDQAAAELAVADVVGFSCYVWNYAYHLQLASRLKQLKPEILIVCGGPQVPDAPADFLARFPFIDVCVHGEGERTFLQLLETWPNQDWREIPGISYRKAGHCLTQARAPRISDLDEIPSPYLSGVYEPLMRKHPDLAWAGVWETNRGCPFSCTFCDWGSNLNSKVTRFGLERVKQEMQWFGQHQIQFLFCTDANFGLLPRDLEIAAGMVAVRQTYGHPKKLIIQMTKNQPERAFEAHRLLYEAELLMSVTLSFQSVSPMALQAIRRDNISMDVYRQLQTRFAQYGIPTYTDMLIGLPGESFESFAAGVAEVITMGQYHEQRFYHTYLLPNAEMSAPEYRQRHGIETIVVPFYSPYLAAQNPEGMGEEYEMVVATNTMPRQDWIRARALAWMTDLIYYSPVLQLPLLLVQALSQGQVSHHRLLRAFFDGPLPAEMPVLQQFRHLLHARARAVIAGQPESCQIQDPQTGHAVWVSVAEFVTSQLLFSPKLGQFYQECQALIEALLQQTGSSLPPKLLSEALQLTRALLEARLPQRRTFELALSYNLWGCYQQIRRGETIRLETGSWQVQHVPDASGRHSPSEVCLVPQRN